MFSFENANALVVGGAGGIGRALALEYAQRGARVAVADIDEEGALETAALIKAAGGYSLGLACDVTDAVSLTATVASAEESLGSIDISCNAVGVLLSGNPEDIPLAEWERVFRINVFGAARLNELVLPKMLERGQGYIVNIASVAGLTPFAVTRIPYAASKAALISMSENLAIYLKPKGIRVSCLCPGPTATPIGTRSNDWTEGLQVVGPGGDYSLMLPQQAARIFCDGMEAGQVVILSHRDTTRGYMQRHASSPEQFIDERIEQFAEGDYGLPDIDLSDPGIVSALRSVQGGSQGQ